jgi:hypothetical protein
MSSPNVTKVHLMLEECGLAYETRHVDVFRQGQFDPAFLAEMPIAFEGTATEVGDDRVTLEVDRWFKGGDADEVTLTAPAGLEALIAGIDFQEGTSYLISATDGTVNYCGYSGEVTPELTAGFEAAFAD